MNQMAHGCKDVNEHESTREFERLLCQYTGAPFAVAVDNCCNALFLCLRYILNEGIWEGQKITIPSHTYIGVPYAIRASGFIPVGEESPAVLTGEYQLKPYPIWDSALLLTSGMYKAGQFQCLSFTGPYKTLKLGKGGAILTDSEEAAIWLRRAAFSGRNYVSYHADTFDMPEWYNHYLHPMIATLGVQMMRGLEKNNKPLSLLYPDWTTQPAFKQNPYANGTTI
jgi:dTDP-4-amino-4,6-dideoxygalactose transaminase